MTPMATTVRELLLGAKHVERGQIHTVPAVRAGLIVFALVSITVAADKAYLGLPLAVGTVFVTLSNVGESAGRRLRNMLWTTLWITVATFLGGAGSHKVLIGLALTIAISMLAGLAGILGPRATLMGVLTLVAYVIFDGAPASDRSVVESTALVATGGLLTIVITLLPSLFDPTLRHRGFDHIPPLRARLAGKLNSQNDFVRHAVRLTVVMSIATVIADITTYPHDYWMPMTIAWVTKPDRDGTATSIIGRIAGTVVGVLVAAVVIEGLHLKGYGVAAVVGVAAGIAVGFILANYTIAVTGITLMVVGLLTFDGDPVIDTIVLRLIFTVIGAVLAFLGFCIWPPARVPEPDGPGQPAAQG